MEFVRLLLVSENEFQYSVTLYDKGLGVFEKAFSSMPACLVIIKLFNGERRNRYNEGCYVD